MSAQNTVLTALRASQRGAFDYLPKPFEPKELTLRIKKILNRSRVKDIKTIAEKHNLYICGKSLLSCQVRNNDVHFGAFPATGRTIPRQ